MRRDGHWEGQAARHIIFLSIYYFIHSFILMFIYIFLNYQNKTMQNNNMGIKKNQQEQQQIKVRR